MARSKEGLLNRSFGPATMVKDVASSQAESEQPKGNKTIIILAVAALVGFFLLTKKR
jgi:hypothetical protein